MSWSLSLRSASFGGNSDIGFVTPHLRFCEPSMSMAVMAVESASRVAVGFSRAVAQSQNGRFGELK
jgi:hypothetical protein